MFQFSTQAPTILPSLSSLGKIALPTLQLVVLLALSQNLLDALVAVESHNSVHLSSGRMTLLAAAAAAAPFLHILDVLIIRLTSALSFPSPSPGHDAAFAATDSSVQSIPLLKEARAARQTHLCQTGIRRAYHPTTLLHRCHICQATTDS
nr:hypothetical protein CFP56_04545 [Quercus suber]